MTNSIQYLSDNKNIRLEKDTIYSMRLAICVYYYLHYKKNPMKICIDWTVLFIYKIFISSLNLTRIVVCVFINLFAYLLQL